VYAEELDSVLERSWEAGLEHLVVIGSGYGPGSFHEAVAVAEGDARIVAAVGVHPHDARHWSPVVRNELATVVQHPKVRAWGEIGLDYHSDTSPREAQRACFREQLESARQADLPVVIHTRDADEDTLAILDGWADFERGVLIHCFSGGPEFARELVARGAYLAFSGIVTFPRAEPVREAARACPADRLLAETDSPFLSPHPHRGRRNEPARVAHVLATLAEIRGTDEEVLCAELHENARRFFSL